MTLTDLLMLLQLFILLHSVGKLEALLGKET
jgi:hypothetical protein